MRNSTDTQKVWEPLTITVAAEEFHDDNPLVMVPPGPDTPTAWIALTLMIPRRTPDGSIENVVREVMIGADSVDGSRVEGIPDLRPIVAEMVREAKQGSQKSDGVAG